MRRSKITVLNSDLLPSDPDLRWKVEDGWVVRARPFAVPGWECVWFFNERHGLWGIEARPTLPRTGETLVPEIALLLDGTVMRMRESAPRLIRELLYDEESRHTYRIRRVASRLIGACGAVNPVQHGPCNREHGHPGLHRNRYGKVWWNDAG